MDNPPLKHCHHCNQDFPASKEFWHANRSRKDGLCAWCKVCNRAHAKKYSDAHPQLYRDAAKKWRQNNLERSREKSRKWYSDLRLETLLHYGGSPPKCACCGESQLEFLAIDHINGGGRQSRLKHGRGGQYFQRLRKLGWPEGYQVLCHNCNVAKSYYGACPHTKPSQQS